ncbi:rhomboid-like protein [Streptomyces rimosus]|uniref:rhomboid-like protein n=1 Tax=Streptomyces rimosus TaxID=1927 RepID=UPI0004C656DE|nr:rhomboid-like protein [Streptomyces rimosus]
MRDSLRPAALARAVWSYVRRAPGTFIWLAILFGTSVIVHHLTPDTLEHVLQRRSTNIHNLLFSPGRVLLTSALWLDGGGWPLYFILFNIFHVPAERWLGTRRWLAVMGVAHIGATYLSEGVLALAIHTDAAPHSAVNTLDVGVSYALAGVIAVLTYRLPWHPLRYVYAAGVLVFYAIPLFDNLTFTDIGHLSAALLGLACYPLTPNGRARTRGMWSRRRPRRRSGGRVGASNPGRE